MKVVSLKKFVLVKLAPNGNLNRLDHPGAYYLPFLCFYTHNEDQTPIGRQPAKYESHFQVVCTVLHQVILIARFSILHTLAYRSGLTPTVISKPVSTSSTNIDKFQLSGTQVSDN